MFCCFLAAAVAAFICWGFLGNIQRSGTDDMGFREVEKEKRHFKFFEKLFFIVDNTKNCMLKIYRGRTTTTL